MPVFMDKCKKAGFKRSVDYFLRVLNIVKVVAKANPIFLENVGHIRAICSFCGERYRHIVEQVLKVTSG